MKFSEEMKFLCFLVLIAVVVSAVDFLPVVAARVKERFFLMENGNAAETVAETPESLSESETATEDIGIHPLE